MAKSIPAIITPEVLAWARNLDGITIDDIAAKLHTAPERYCHGSRELRTRQ